MTLGDILKALREGKGLNQKDFYHNLDISVSQTKHSNWENDHAMPDFYEGCVLAEFLHMTPNELWEKIKSDPLYKKKYSNRKFIKSEGAEDGEKREEKGA